MRSATRPQYHRLQRILELIREGTDQFRDAFGISQADRPWKVRLLFAREVVTYILNESGTPASNCGSAGMAPWSSACRPPVARN